MVHIKNVEDSLESEIAIAKKTINSLKENLKIFEKKYKLRTGSLK